MRYRSIFLLVCFLIVLAPLLISCGSSQAPLPINEQFTVNPVFGSWLYSVTPNIKSFCFYLYIPDDYNSSQESYPFLLFLQGWGNFGTAPNPMLLSAGPLRSLYVSDTQLDPSGLDRLDSRVRHSIIAYPMMPYYDGTYQDPLGWYNPETLNKIVEYIMACYRVDRKRLYVAGLSEGGGGSWGYAWKYPEKVAAVIPVSCGLSWQATDGLKAIPTWIFHSFDDTYVPHQSTSDAAFNALTGTADVMQTYPHINGDVTLPAAGDFTISYDTASGLGPWTPGTVYPTGIITYTLYASGGHDAWTRAYANDDVWKWLYTQSK